MKKQIYQGTCLRCGKPFETKWSTKRYCDDCPPSTRVHKNLSAGPGASRKWGGKAPPRKCVQCGREFQPSLTRNDARFCSRTCQGKGINAKGLGPRHSDEEFLDRLVAVINAHDRCLSNEELTKEVGTSHSTLSSRGWTMEFLYDKAGRTYDPPILCSRFEDRVGEVLQKIYPDDLIESDKKLPGMKGFKGGDLRVDYYIKSQKLIVEADGRQHADGRGDAEKQAEIHANDRLKDAYAAANNLTLVRIAEEVDPRVIEARLLRGIRRVHPRFRPLTPSNPGNPKGRIQRMTKRRDPGSRPRGDKGEPFHDIYCRGCHARPSLKNKATYFCEKCWALSKKLWLTSRVLADDEALSFKNEVVEFVKKRGRYVWHPEVFLFLRPIAMSELKRHKIKIAKICRDLGYFAPADDRFTIETVRRVREFVESFMAEHGRSPKVRELIAGARVDYDTLWSCMDYDAYVDSLGGKLKTDIRHRFRSEAEFLATAAEVVRNAGHPIAMTKIMEALGICYPAYLAHFKAVRSNDIHDAAGVPRLRRRRKKS